jgi:hypothetical protein
MRIRIAMAFALSLAPATAPAEAIMLPEETREAILRAALPPARAPAGPPPRLEPLVLAPDGGTAAAWAVDLDATPDALAPAPLRQATSPRAEPQDPARLAPPLDPLQAPPEPQRAALAIALSRLPEAGEALLKAGPADPIQFGLGLRAAARALLHGPEAAPAAGLDVADVAAEPAVGAAALALAGLEVDPVGGDPDAEAEALGARAALLGLGGLTLLALLVMAIAYRPAPKPRPLRPRTTRRAS